MKEKIYTIPITEAFKTASFCPICLIENRLEEESVDYTLGASMMEPDFRIITNHSGFCPPHYRALRSRGNALGLSLILQTHLSEILKSFDKAGLKMSSGGFALHKKSAAVVEETKRISESCAICDRVDHFMEKYIDNTVFLWETDPDFKKLFDQNKSFCLRHFAHLTGHAQRTLSKKSFRLFLKELSASQKELLSCLHDDITEFVNSFDYRNKDLPLSDDAKASIERTIEFFR